MQRFPEKIHTRHKEFMLQCELDAEDIAAYWIKDGALLNDNHPCASRIDVSCNGKVHTLKVRNLVDSDSGMYTFTAGDKKCSSNIFVEGVLEKSTFCTVFDLSTVFLKFIFIYFLMLFQYSTSMQVQLTWN